MEKVIRLKEADLIRIVESSVERKLEEENKKKYHLTEAELRAVIKHFIDKK